MTPLEDLAARSRRYERRARLYRLAAWCVLAVGLVFLVTQGPSDVTIEGGGW